jgi:hypothetical protein
MFSNFGTPLHYKLLYATNYSKENLSAIWTSCEVEVAWNRYGHKLIRPIFSVEFLAPDVIDAVWLISDIIHADRHHTVHSVSSLFAKNVSEPFYSLNVVMCDLKQYMSLWPAISLYISPEMSLFGIPILSTVTNTDAK